MANEGHFKPGHERIGGRAKGTKNKNTEMRNNLRDFVLNNYEKFEEAFDKLSPKMKCDVYLKAAEFVLPKMSSIKFEDAKDSNSGVDLLRITATYRNDS